MSDYYELLGVAHEATPEQIKKAFRERAFEHHPDRNPNNPASEEQFKKINEAYSTLGDSDKKSRYDAAGYTTEAYRPNRTSGENPYGQYTWTYTTDTSRRTTPVYSKREVVEMLMRNIFTLIIGILLFRFSGVFGIFGILICITAIGRGLMNSLRAIMLLVKIKE